MADAGPVPGLFVATGALEATGFGERAAQWRGGTGVDLHSPPTQAVATAVLSNPVNNSGVVATVGRVPRPRGP
jgi:hypothetical protein